MSRREAVRDKLVVILGEKQAEEVFRLSLTEAKLAEVESADDQLTFATVLMRKGGVLEAIGRSLKIQAILHGAKEEAPGD